MNLKEKIERLGKSQWLFFLTYTLCFSIMTVAVFSVFLLYKKSFVWVPDGLQQHFNALLYYRSWLLDILHTLVTEHRLEIPLWDMSIGMGSDILTTLHYYVIGDPLNLLSVFVPAERYMEGFYCALVILRLYLAGLAFSAYCRYHGQKPYSMLLGAMVYDFCFWAIVAIRHPYFLNPMIYLPLILLGVDKIYKKEKPWLYIGMLALATISSFYFAYMICIFVVAYAVLRYLMIFRKVELKVMVGWIGRFLGYSVAALASVSVVLVPVVAMTLSTGRAEAKHDFSLFYPFSYYKNFISGFLIGGTGYWSELGYTGLILIAVIFLLSNRKKYLGLRIGFVFMTLLVLLPYAGLILNGGSYVINRYMWAYSMLVSFIAVKMYPQIMDMRRKKRIELFWAGITYIFICMEVCSKSRKQYVVIALVMFAVLLGLIIGTSKKMKETFLFKSVLLVVVMCELVYQGWVKYAPWAEGYVEEFANRGEAYHMLNDYAAGSLVKSQAENTTWRYESLQAEEWKNTAMQLGIHGVSYYFSLANPYINEFQREMYLNQTRDFCYSGLDGRAMLDMLAGVRYFVIPEGNKGLLPYGYDTCINRGTLGAGSQYEVKAVAYENEEVLPFAFASDRYISRDTYEKMSVTEKQQALLQGIVVEKDAFPVGTSAIEPKFTEKTLPYEITEIKGAEWVDGGIKVTEEGATLTLSFSGIPKSETYFIFEGLDYKGKGGVKKSPKSRLHIQITNGKISKKITFLTAKNNFYSGVTDFLINTGYREEASEEITVKFQEEGTYYFEKMKIVAQPMEQLLENRQEMLQQETLENVSLLTNEVTGTICVNEKKLLCITLPYSSGWSAYVDGVETEVLQADTMFMAILVPEGSHEIRFAYCTPYLRAGAVLSILGIGCIVVMIVLQKRKERQQHESSEQ